MAVKELALITEKKKRKKKESVQAAPTKPIKETISNNKGTTKINRSTISTKPSAQKTPQNRVVTNKERLTSNPTISDIRTVKTSNFKPKSIQTVDLYERGGRYFYKDGKKEKEVDQKFVQNALKNNKSGVIGRYNSKGKLEETDSRGNVKTAKAIRREKFDEVGKQLNTWKDNIKSGNVSVSQAITDAANTFDAATELPGLKQAKIYKKTLDNAIINATHGIGKGVESGIDLVGGALGFDTSKDVVRDLEKKLGYTDEAREKYENNSLITHDNLGGKLTQAGGELLLDVATGNAVLSGVSKLGKAGKLGKLGKYIGNPEAYTATKGLKGLDKAKALGKNAAIDLGNKSIQQAPMVLSSGGRAFEESSAAGATPEEQKDYAAKKMGLTFALNNLFVGVPGLKNDKGFLDGVIQKSIGKPIAKITDKIPSEKLANGVKAAIKSAGKGTGEAFEENLEGVLTALLKNSTYSDGEKYTLAEAKEDALIAFVLGNLFEVGNTKNEIELENATKKRKAEIKDLLAKDVELKTGLTDAMNRVLQKNGIKASDDSTINDLKSQLQQTELAKQIQVNEINQRVNSGEIDAEEGNVLLDQVDNGTYAQNKNLETIAIQQKEQLDRQLQQGLITDEQYNQELRDIANAIKQTREQINTPQNQIETQPQTNKTTQDNAITQETQNVAQNEQNEGVQENSQQNRNNIDNNTDVRYNNNEKGDVSDEFRELQRESQNISNEEQQLYRRGSKEIDDNLRGRLSRVLGQRVESSRSSNSNDARILKDNKSGNEFEVYDDVDGQTFRDLFEIARTYTRNGELVDLHPVESGEYETGYNDTKNYVSKDGLSGFAITKDGDLISVFNANNKRGWLRAIAPEIKAKAKTLDCYMSENQPLHEMYEKIFGFKVASIMDYNMEYDHDDIAKNHNMPQVAFMVKTDKDIETKHFNKDQYDEAEAYRNSLVDKNETSDSSVSNENALAKREEGALDKEGNLVMAPFLKDNGGKNNGGSGKNTTALGKQPQPKKGSVEADILRSYDERLKNKKKTFKEKISEDIHEATRAWLDMGEEIARIGKGHNDADLYPLYDLSKTAKASADYSINANQTNLNGEKIGESLNKVWEEVENKDLVYEMNKYLYELHNIDRWNQFNEDGSRKYVFGPEHSDLVSKKNIAELERLHPELKKLSKPILKYQKNLSQLLVDSGIRSKEQQDVLDSIYKNYVPTWRDKDDVGINATSNYGGNISVNNQTKKATGSTTDLLPLKEVQALMTENIFKASRTNVFLQQLYKDIGDIDALKEIGMKNLKSNTNIEPIDSKQFYAKAEEELDKYLKENAPNNAKVEKVDGQPVATLWFNGEKVSMPIDKGIQVALEPVVVEGRAAEILNTINNLKRGLITQYNPIFAATNAIKDAADAAVNSKFSAVEYKAEYLKSFKDMVTNKKMSKEDWTLFNQYLAMGGYSNTVFDKRTGFAKQSKGAKKVVDKIGDLNDFIEQIPRFTEFKLTLKHGGTLTEAMYNAAEVTTNFKRSGVLTKKLDKLATTFFSASTAGFYKQVRNLTQQPNGKAFARFATKALALGLTPAIINSLMYANPFGDDDDKDEAQKAYKNLPQYVKDNYLVWYTGNGKFMRIPKGRVVSIPGIAYNAAKNKVNKEEITFGEIAMSMLNQVGPSNPLSSNAILQIWQSGLFDNDSQGTSWSGNKIESYYLHKKPVTERYDSRTDKFSTALSKALSKATKGKIQISPKKLSYTLEQNSGIIGDITLPWLTPKSTGPSTVSRVANPILSKFTTDTVVSNKTSEKFYNEVNKYSEKIESSNATRQDLVKNSYLGSINGEIAEKRKEIEKVESSSLSKNEKYRKTRDLQKDINALQEKGLKETGTYKNISEYVSEIGGDTYYKSSYEGRTTWKKETDKTKAIRDDLGLSAKDYYYYKNEESYTPKGGKAQYITSGKNAKYNIAMVDAFNFDPSDYLEYKYKLSKIRGDKGANGKTIRYSARKKKIAYLNTLPISSVEKAYLMKQSDRYYKSSDKSLKKAIKSSSMSEEDKKQIYSYLRLGR